MISVIPKQFKQVNDLSVDVPDHVISTWNRYRQTECQTEACGFIIGGYIPNSRTIVIDDCTTPGLMDIRRRTSYQLRDKKHSAAVLSAYHKTNGYSNFLGIWHTHPEPHPTPSNIDLSDWKRRMLENRTLIPAFIFAIIGTQTTSYFIYKNKRFTYEK
uniref:JAB domain-containing protein n=1 Tax=Aliivibrio wodanis TaxID=80852 RepID=A0A5Q4ZHH8_9GAMM|nr:hypothetical protein [synthetic construct]VVV03660.1 hypothetical protein AW0309160_01043 [Aliivibrio wodanis]